MITFLEALWKMGLMLGRAAILMVFLGSIALIVWLVVKHRHALPHASRRSKGVEVDLAELDGGSD